MIKIRRHFALALHVLGALFFLALCPFLAFQAGDWHWPYVVQSVDVVPDPVERGGTITVYATRNYLENCDLRFERRLESVSNRDHPPVILTAEEGPTPWRYNGKPQPIYVAIPKDFPCGSAQIRTSPSASCNWLQKHVPQRRADALTPFDVSCTG